MMPYTREREALSEVVLIRVSYTILSGNLPLVSGMRGVCSVSGMRA